MVKNSSGLFFLLDLCAVDSAILKISRLLQADWLFPIYDTLHHTPLSLKKVSDTVLQLLVTLKLITIPSLVIALFMTKQ